MNQPSGPTSPPADAHLPGCASRFTWISRNGLTLSGTEWCPPASMSKPEFPPVLCLAGLSRNSRDFNSIADYLQARGQRVIALDYRGRGQSDWDADWQNYSIPVEGQDIDDALEQLEIDRFSILGTSRGGLHAMAMAARFGSERISGIVLNDIGPHIEIDSIGRLAATIGKTMHFADKGACAEHLKAGLGRQFPALKGEDWVRFAGQLGSASQDSASPKGFTLDYDPELGKTLAVMDEGAELPDLWPLFETMLPIPLLILRGEHSDLLSKETCKKMLALHPRADLMTVPGEGHAPLLWDLPVQEKVGLFLKP
ncbi:alpha/beta fold hydrolase [Roseibium algae]|uniref:Alpha/beta hydrolase n=1 Tax=Roseibium algae TaxID=3123038 RepID=A0ABU8TJQ9_9HYPH